MKFIKHLFFITIIFSCKTSVDSNPNFIFIYTDDQRFDALGIMSNENVITPNLDELAKSGAILTNVYNMGGYHGAVCVASRSMMISGKSFSSSVRIRVGNRSLERLVKRGSFRSNSFSFRAI